MKAKFAKSAGLTNIDMLEFYSKEQENWAYNAMFENNTWILTRQVNYTYGQTNRHSDKCRKASLKKSTHNWPFSTYL